VAEPSEREEQGGHEPESIYRRTAKEGERRLSRPALQLGATSFVAGIDVVFGIIALAVANHLVSARFGPQLGDLAGALAFGSAFVFIVVGRSELFTENFLVPIAGMNAHSRRDWYKLAELWTISPIVNILGGFILILIVTSNGVLPEGTGAAITTIVERYDNNDVATAFASAIAAGALITLMTWLVEGIEHLGVNVFCAWLVGALLALGTFNHVIVVTLQYLMAIRYGADVGWEDAISNFGVAAIGNLLGGVLFVTLTRMGQATAASRA